MYFEKFINTLTEPTYKQVRRVSLCFVTKCYGRFTMSFAGKTEWFQMFRINYDKFVCLFFYFVFKKLYQNTDFQLFWRKFSFNSVFEKPYLCDFFFKILMFAEESNSTLLKGKLIARNIFYCFDDILITFLELFGFDRVVLPCSILYDCGGSVVWTDQTIRNVRVVR